MNPVQRIALGLKVIARVRNWSDYFRDLRHKKKGMYQLRMRSGEVFSLRANTVDRGIVTEVWVSRCYPLPKDCTHKTIIDIGGQIGMFTTFAARRGARVFTFEPAPENYRLLVQNVRQNKLDKTVTTEMAAVSDRKGWLSLNIDDTNTGGHSLVWKTTHATRVRTTTLHEVFKKHRIITCDYLKLDAEGSEYAIMYSAPDDTLRRIKMIVMEVHDIPGKNTNAEAMTAFLKKKHFRVERPDGYIVASQK